MSPPPCREAVERPVTAPHTPQQAFLDASEGCNRLHPSLYAGAAQLVRKQANESMQSLQKRLPAASGGCSAAPPQ